VHHRIARANLVNDKDGDSGHRDRAQRGLARLDRPPARSLGLASALSGDERKIAPILFQALLVAQKLIATGTWDPAEVKAASCAILAQQPAARVEYQEVVDPQDMQPVERITGPVRVAAAIWLGSTRLIDNMLCEPAAALAPGLIQ
jgi:pantothenate synthetase